MEKASTSNDTIENEENLTPKSKTDREMRNLGLSPNRHAKVRRRILVSNVIEGDLKSQVEKKKMVKVILPSARKYRCKYAVSRALGIDRRTLNRKESKNYRELKRRKLEQKVITF